MDKHAIELSGAAKYGPYSAGVEAGDMFWLSGQIAVDFDGIKAQTQGALDKIDTLLNNAELTRENICFAQILLDDIKDFAAMNEVYGAWVSELKVKPARAAFAAAASAARSSSSGSACSMSPSSSSSLCWACSSSATSRTAISSTMTPTFARLASRR